ncbi:toll/interleukin-1 receptor domain-containing protein [Actinoplanes sp. DH11]|uniref:toll/interleukin-1 receptor domain-containing protein n=1 Tax=Actinoplanes sp. DH11 TaxID=2857011 RepID=UPI001E4C0FF5|nr:toll/interleukin-1 receptor domain-containing protein [Actinoplanes sp. DH11]
MPILVSHAVPDGPWANWIAQELRAAGHAVDVHIARSDFAHRLLTASSGSDPVLALFSAEHPATESDWQRLLAATGDRLVLLCVDAAGPPRALRGMPCRSLHDLDAEGVRELLLDLFPEVRRNPQV